MKGVKKIDASGRIDKLNLIKPYPPSFKRFPDKITDPSVGASTWASGYQVWSGNKGTLIKKPKVNSRNKVLDWDEENSRFASVSKSSARALLVP